MGVSPMSVEHMAGTATQLLVYLFATVAGVGAAAGFLPFGIIPPSSSCGRGMT
jgi:hypothetical protein